MQKVKHIVKQPLSKKERFNNAINSIENFLTDYRGDYKFKLADKTTDNFLSFKNETLKNGYITISKQGNDKTIYTKSTYNIIARLWHDNLHLQHNLDFSIDDEKIVCYLQIAELETYLVKRGVSPCTIQDATEIIYHDIIGQVDFYANNKKFVDNQMKFVYSRFLVKGGN